jgi:hypothetical protein
MRLSEYEPLNDAELEEIERYTSEALSYRHQPEFVHECARLIAEVKRLRRAQVGRRWNLARFGLFFAPQRWLNGAEVSGSGAGGGGVASERRLQWE